MLEKAPKLLCQTAPPIISQSTTICSEAPCVEVDGHYIESQQHHMSKEHRRSSKARGRGDADAGADARPSFARPPGARATPPSSYPSQQPSPARRRSRSREHSRHRSDWTSDGDNWSDLERRRRGEPPQPQKRPRTKPHKAKAPPAVSPVKKHASEKVMTTNIGVSSSEIGTNARFPSHRYHTTRAIRSVIAPNTPQAPLQPAARNC